ncbi:DUF2490 domain-containing protein [Flavobacterium sp.]|uniref:DUF2490 domain-containing protein n=1 Tax=Flavobacterium sp. TaxID=239 RepID=UPI0037513DCF
MQTKKTLFILLFLAIVLYSSAQTNTDFQFRFAPSIDYKINKKWKVGFNYRYGLEKDISTFQSSVFQFSGEYKINKKISIEAGYRFSTSYEANNQRLFTSFLFDFKIKKFTLSSRTRYQFSTSYFNTDFWNEFKEPNQYIRQKFTLDYNIPKSKASVYFSPEFFVKWDDSRFKYNRTRYQLGSNYNLKYGSTIGLSLVYEDKWNSTKTDRFIITTKYNLSIDELMKKKKKKNKKSKKEKD